MTSRINMARKKKITYLGLGTMGFAMAKHILSAGYNLTVWNRTSGPAEKLSQQGAKLAATAAEAVQNADIIFYSMANDQAIDDVVFSQNGILNSVCDGQIAVNLSTVHPDMSKREAEAYRSLGVGFLDAPVFGSLPEAEQADLCIVVGGELDVYQQVTSVFTSFSSSTHYMGVTGQGAAMGLIGSLLVAMQLQALGESLMVARRAGLDLNQVLDIISLPDFRSPIFSGMGAGVIQGDFHPVFSLQHLHKDTDQLAKLAEQLQVPITASAVVRETIKSAIRHGWGEQNASALIKALELQANVKLKQ